MTATTAKKSRAVRSLAARALRITAAGIDFVRPTRCGVTILAYHTVGLENGSMVDVPIDQFRSHLKHLATQCTVVPLNEAVVAVAEGETSPCVVVTFDDGTQDFVTNALPALEEFAIPATVYVATGFVGSSQTPWNTAALSWRDIDVALDSGLVSIEAHTHQHLVLDKVSPAQASDDFAICNDAIEAHTGRLPRHLAYPKGVVPHPEVDAVVREVYDSAATGRVGVNVEGCDLFRLSRSPVQSVDSDAWFARKAAGGLGFEGQAREVANRVRYRNSDT